VCSIKTCAEKQGNDKLLCSACIKFPCRRIKDLDKRYRLKYGESSIQNLIQIEALGIARFMEQAKEKWRCNSCGSLVCVHRGVCLNCGNTNMYFPKH
jgi:rubrerythrin